MEQVEKYSGKRAEALDREVELDADEVWYMDAFMDLSARRLTVDNVVHRIPLTEVECYARLHNVLDVEMFSHAVTEMDRVYVPYQAAKIRQEIEKAIRKKRRGK